MKIMKRKLLFGIPMLLAFVLFFSVDVQAQGYEDFTNSTLTGSYADGSFVGNDGITWTYVHSRDEATFPIDENGIMLRRANEPSSLSAIIPGGVGSFSVDTRKAYTGNAQRQLELVINGIVVDQFLPEFGEGADDTVIPFVVDDINIGGSVELELRLFGSDGNQQMILDNIEWTGYGAVPPVVTNVVQTPDSDISSATTVMVSADVTEGDAAIESVELHWGTESEVYPNSILMSPEKTVSYITDEEIPAQDDGTTVYFVVKAEDVDGEIFTTLEHEYTVVDPAIVSLPYTEAFDDDLGDVYSYSVSGDSKFWTHASFGGNGYAEMNGFNSGDIENDWLIFPGIDMSAYDNTVLLNFETAYNFGSFDDDNFIKLFYSEDYAGIGDPTLATWTELEFDLPETGNYTWTPSGDVMLPESENTVYIALQYHYNPGEYRRWQVDNIVIEEEPPLEPAEPLDLFTWMDKTGENIPAELGVGNNARAAALCMNRYVVVPSREGGNNVWVWDSHNPDDPPVALNPGDGYVSGLFLINYVQAANGHVYVSNMTLGTNNWHPFKVYRWAGLDAEPEVIINLTYDVDDPDMNWGRLGDSFSIIGNPADEGHIIAHVASGGDGNRKFLKWNFVDGVNQNPQEPEIITVDATFNINSYGSFNPIEGEDDLFLVTGNTMGIALVDLDGVVHAYLGTDIISMRSMEPRVFYYEGKRYLSYVVSNEADAVSGAYYDVIDISMGDNVLEAFESITTLEDLNLRRAHSFVLGGGNAFYSSTHNVSHTPEGEVVFLSYVLGRGFILESTEELELEPPIELPFDIIFNQPYHDGGTAATSAFDSEAEIDYMAADNFSGLEEEIEEFVFYGLTLKNVDGAWTEQEPGETEPFFVYFYDYEVDMSTGLLAPVTGDYQIALVDDYSDGWNGGEVTVYVNGVAVLTEITLASGGGPEYYDFYAEEGDEISTVYSPGSWSYENYYAILDPDANIIAEDGGTWDDPGDTTPEGIEPGGDIIALEPDWANPVDEFYGDFDVEHVGTVWNGAYQLYKFSASFETPINMEEGWISAQIDADNGSGTWFLWLNSLAGDELAWQYTGEGEKTQFTRDMVDLSGISQKENIFSTKEQLEYDMAFELWGGEINSTPVCATNPMPADEAIGVAIDGYLSWTGDPIAEGYMLYFGLEGGEWEIADGVDLGHVTSFAFEGLVYSLTYEWKVVAYNALGEAEECPTWSFTTMQDPLQQLPYAESFDELTSGSLPEFWDRTHTNWAVNNSNSAGGEAAPELRFNWSPSFTGVLRATTPPIDPGDAESFGLTFMHSVNDYSGDYTLKVQTSVDGETWTDQWVIDMESKKNVPADREASNKEDVPPTFEVVNLSDLAGEIFHIAFVFEGNSFNINQWYIDDIVVDEMEFFDLTFNVVGAHHGLDIDDAIITLNGVANEAGDYEFADLLEGTYAYTVSRLCYEDVTGEVTVNEDMEVDIELDLDLMPGDANGDGVVDVLDLIAIGNYYIGNDPGYFCFHNADVNDDGEVDVLDIIGVVNIFKKGGVAPHAGLQSSPASIYLSDSGIELYSDGTLAGIQFEIAGEMLQGLELKLDLPGHEIIYVYENGTIRAMIFSIENAAIPEGKISLVRFSNDVDAEWNSVKAGNLNAEEVPVETYDDDVTSIEEASDIAFTAYPNPASDILWVEFHNTGESSLSLINVQGQVVETQMVHNQGETQISFTLGNLTPGIYMIRLDNDDASIIKRIMIK